MRVGKLCMIGDFGVGKTSLVERYVNHHFSNDYITTVGVTINTKELTLSCGNRIKLVLWDIGGTDNLSSVEKAYLTGAAGYLLVADGTRPETLESCLSLQQQADRILGGVPFTLMLNKRDLTDLWGVDEQNQRELDSRGWAVVPSSAKEGTGVENAFQLLGERLGSA
jgi:small GTP-binding protein